jgi:coproporphyrinogen III oxidase
MPLNCSWSYRREDASDSPEGRLLSDFLVAKDWV